MATVYDKIDEIITARDEAEAKVDEYRMQRDNAEEKCEAWKESAKGFMKQRDALREAAEAAHTELDIGLTYSVQRAKQILSDTLAALEGKE